MDHERSESIHLHVACVGEALWDLRVPKDKPLEIAEHVALEPGGGAVNVALGLAQLGVEVKLIAAAGDDLVGRALITTIEHAGVDVSFVGFTKTRTGLVWLTSVPPRAISYRSVKEEARALRGVLPRWFGAGIVHFSGLLPSRVLFSSFTRAARDAHKEGSLVTLDVNMRPRLWTEKALAKADPRELFAEIDVLKVSEDDLRMLGVTNPEALRERLRSDGVLVLTRGSLSTRAWGPFGEVKVEVSPLDVKSTIGAGDAFVAGLLSVLASDKTEGIIGAETITKALHRGNEVAFAELSSRLALSK